MSIRADGREMGNVVGVGCFSGKFSSWKMTSLERKICLVVRSSSLYPLTPYR